MTSINKEYFEREFICPKCHGHGAVTQEVSIGRHVAGVFPLPANRYLAVSCGLCGYTEFYQMAIAVRADDEVPAINRLATEKPE